MWECSESDKDMEDPEENEADELSGSCIVTDVPIYDAGSPTRAYTGSTPPFYSPGRGHIDRDEAGEDNYDQELSESCIVTDVPIHNEKLQADQRSESPSSDGYKTADEDITNVVDVQSSDNEKARAEYLKDLERKDDIIEKLRSDLRKLNADQDQNNKLCTALRAEADFYHNEYNTQFDLARNERIQALDFFDQIEKLEVQLRSEKLKRGKKRTGGSSRDVSMEKKGPSSDVLASQTQDTQNDQEKGYACSTCQLRYHGLHDLLQHTDETDHRPMCPKCSCDFSGNGFRRHHKGCPSMSASMGGLNSDNEPEAMQDQGKERPEHDDPPTLAYRGLYDSQRQDDDPNSNVTADRLSELYNKVSEDLGRKDDIIKELRSLCDSLLGHPTTKLELPTIELADTIKRLNADQLQATHDKLHSTNKMLLDRITKEAERYDLHWINESAGNARVVEDCRDGSAGSITEYVHHYSTDHHAKHLGDRDTSMKRKSLLKESGDEPAESITENVHHYSIGHRTSVSPAPPLANEAGSPVADYSISPVNVDIKPTEKSNYTKGQKQLLWYLRRELGYCWSDVCSVYNIISEYKRTYSALQSMNSRLSPQYAPNRSQSKKLRKKVEDALRYVTNSDSLSLKLCEYVEAPRTLPLDLTGGDDVDGDGDVDDDDVDAESPNRKVYTLEQKQLTWYLRKRLSYPWAMISLIYNFIYRCRRTLGGLTHHGQLEESNWPDQAQCEKFYSLIQDVYREKRSLFLDHRDESAGNNRVEDVEMECRGDSTGKTIDSHGTDHPEAYNPLDANTSGTLLKIYDLTGNEDEELQNYQLYNPPTSITEAVHHHSIGREYVDTFRTLQPNLTGDDVDDVDIESALKRHRYQKKNRGKGKRKAAEAGLSDRDVRMEKKSQSSDVNVGTRTTIEDVDLAKNATGSQDQLQTGAETTPSVSQNHLWSQLG